MAVLIQAPENLNKEATNLPELAQKMTVNDEHSFRLAANMLQIQCKGVAREIEEFFRPFEEPAKETLNQIRHAKSQILSAVQEAEKILKERMKEYLLENEAKRKELESQFSEHTGTSIMIGSKPPKIPGLVIRRNWKARLVNLPALLEFVLQHPEHRDYVSANEKLLDSLAKVKRKPELGVPGVEGYEELVIAAEAR